jgi:hypothetical protein
VENLAGVHLGKNLDKVRASRTTNTSPRLTAVRMSPRPLATAR